MRVQSCTLITVCCLILLSLTYVTPQEGQFVIKHVQDPLKDWSSRCKNNVILTVFLTISMGQSDSEVLLISGVNGNYPNCTIRYYTGPGVTTIVVFEFPDFKLYERSFDCDGINIELYENSNTNDTFDACQYVRHTKLTHGSFMSVERLISVSISSDRYFQPLKLTTTTARKLDFNEKCDAETEVACIRKGQHELLQLCMSIEVLCDGHLNCGTVGEFDESERICNETGVYTLWIGVVLALLMLAFVSFFLVRLIQRVVPRVGTNFFVFNEDEDNRLNLTSVFTQPMERGRGGQLSSSSYRFRTSSVLIKPTERQQKQYATPNRLSKDSEVEVLSEFPTSQHRKSTLSNRRKDSNKESNTDAAVSQTGNDSKKTHVHIAPVSVKVVPDYDEGVQPHDNVMMDILPKSILGHGHDQVSFPDTPRTSKDMEITKLQKKKKKGLTDVLSSKDLISRKVHHQNDFPETEKPARPERSHRKSSSDSD